MSIKEKISLAIMTLSPVCRTDVSLGTKIWVLVVSAVLLFLSGVVIGKLINIIS